MAHVLRGMLAGALAGCAASWVMNQFMAMRPSSNAPAPAPRGQGQESGQSQASNLDEDATVKTATAISQRVLHRELTPAEKQLAGPLVHYAYGTTIGALYGGLAELMPVTAAGLGMPFGMAIWMLGDEIAVPALGLAKPPTEYGPEVHADALSAHLMYGATTDLLRRVLRHVV